MFEADLQGQKVQVEDLTEDGRGAEQPAVQSSSDAVTENVLTCEQRQRWWRRSSWGPGDQLLLKPPFYIHLLYYQEDLWAEPPGPSCSVPEQRSLAQPCFGHFHNSLLKLSLIAVINISIIWTIKCYNNLLYNKLNIWLISWIHGDQKWIQPDLFC